ncbi:ABC transporter ATP-binding protein [Rhodococcus gordoniae]|uniref:ABC transporter ATP-binding protein n=1 Tax=Rhodococcus gordoniae TaxID=223392 RepID=UPI0020CE15C9|nr:ABC transporter ATP-binding protein [Rhodococcus gordoniae]UTT51159.1 ABC transporter ATP-binding protein [Rhodococcus gordoniae]
MPTSMPAHSAHAHPAISVRQASRHFGDLCVFSDVSFEVAAGRCCAIVGANGAGKSTLLRCVIGADRLDHGSITVHGRLVDESSATFRATVAAVVGEPALFAHLTAHEHLQLVGVAHGAVDPYTSATRILDQVGLAEIADQLPVTMSSGQRHRLALGSALVRPRTIVVLDEPEQHLDTGGRAWLAEAINAEKHAGTAALLVSHDHTLVTAVADEIVDGDSWR